MEKKLTAMQILSGKLQEDINTYKLLPIDTSYEEGFIRDVINRINTEMLPIEREQKIDDFTDGQNKGVMQFVGLLNIN